MRCRARTTLLAGAASLAALAIGAALPALADGGAGGAGANGSVPGGAGGTGFGGTAGQPGGTGAGVSAGGGGGGGGAGGGIGGDGGGAAGVGPGGAGGTAGSPDGGTSFSSDGGGGGGFGGVNGNAAGAASISNSGTLSGGDGGIGGTGADVRGGGGGGGAGGYGAIVTGAGASSNTGTGVIAGGGGGSGGVGGNSRGTGGNGGDGGVGVQFTTPGATFTNSATVTGGNGGTAGTGGFANGTAGAGGAGIVGSGLTITNSGTITGGLANSGAGTRANAITFTGGTNSLTLQAGSTITGNVVAFSAGDTLALGGTTSASFDVSTIGASAQYQGFGIFQKTGSSTWTLTGTNAAALPWTINAGTLAVNGTMTNATMTANGGGTLAGTGTVGATQINSGGTFAPGSGTPGTSMAVSGSLAFQSGASYVVQLNPATASLANVTGTASLNGTVQATFAAGSYTAKPYTILTTTAGLGGTTFAGLVTANAPKTFSETLSYGAGDDDVFLNLTAALGLGTPLNQNQQTTVTALNNFFNNGGTLPPQFANIFNLTGSDLANALSKLDGEASTGAATSTFQLVNDFLNLLSDMALGAGGGGGTSGGSNGFAAEPSDAFPPDVALAYNRALKKNAAQPSPQSFDQRWSAWGSAFGGSATYDGNAVIGSNDLHASDFGFAGGMDYHATPDLKLGFALAGAGTNWNLAGALGGGRSDVLQIAGYAIQHFGPAYLSGIAAFGNSWITTNRIAAFGDQLQATFNGQSYALRGEAGYRFAVMPTAGITPYVAAQTQWFQTPSYSETDLNAGGFGLSFNAATANDTRSELGARADDLTMLGSSPLILRARVAWAHDWVSDPTLGALFQALPGSAFTVNGASVPANSALASAGGQLFLTPNWSIEAKFNGEFASTAQTYAGSGTLRYAW